MAPTLKHFRAAKLLDFGYMKVHKYSDADVRLVRVLPFVTDAMRRWL